MALKNNFTTKNVVGTAVFIALAYAVSFLEFPIFVGASFLKLDFSGVFLMLAGFMYGPILGTIAVVIKETLRLTVSSSSGVGELVNALVYISFILLPAILYQYKKGFRFVVLYLGMASVIEIIVSLVLNRFVTFPLYGAIADFDGVKMFNTTWYLVLIFNLIKTISICILTILLYKRVKFLFEKAGISNNKANSKNDNVIMSKCGKNDNVIISKCAQDTEKFAFNFAKTLNKGDCLVLSGDMGAGKTVFVKGLVKGLNINAEVTSPTYAYLNVYGDYLYHYDFYRLSCGEDAERLGLTDYFGKDNICVFEWAENIEDAINVPCKKVRIDKINDKKRRITVL